MEKSEILTKLNSVFEEQRYAGTIRTKKEFADLLGVNYSNLTQAFNGDERYLNDRLVSKLLQLKSPSEQVSSEVAYSVPLLPINAIGGRLGDYSVGVSDIDCEKIISPVKGATHAIRVHGDSMAPEYPNGSMILIKKINEDIFVEWGRVYVLDTENGVVIKEVHKTDDRNKVECVSLNPDKKYAPFELKTDYIYGWYRVLMVMSIK